MGRVIGDPLARGGWNLRPLRIVARGVAAPPMMAGMPSLWGAELETRARLRPSLSLVGQVGQAAGSRFEVSGRLRFSQGRASLGLVTERHLRRWDASLSAGPVLAVLQQQLEAIELDEEAISPTAFSATQWVPGAYAQGGLHLPVSPALGFDLALRTQILRVQLEEAPSFLIEGALLTGLALNLSPRALGRARRRPAGGS